ncbi:hypothetical protein FRX31_027489 [Thalictrum thalictroides]|uniref:Uncharacterized protein n=1 Tax=Thalictrum thalictroides TaxID=46969 RepID=A0A7J6VE00_THATH|nr:hypothetical protein FRX31_027489 [Thalictrum thalictroides]
MMLCRGTLSILNKGGGKQTQDYLWRTHGESLKIVVSEMEDRLVVIMQKLFDNGVEVALQELGQLEVKFPNSGFCKRFRAALLYQSNSLQDAVDNAELAVKWYPDCLEYRAFCAFLLFKGGGEYKEIIRHCEHALTKMDRGMEIDCEIINKIIPTPKKRTDRLRVLLGLLWSKCHKLMGGEEEEKEWVLEWPWPPYTQECWTGEHKDPNIEALINQVRGANLASTSEPEGMVNAQADAASISDNTNKLQKPKPWNHPLPITKTELNQMRAEFWENAPHSGGQKGMVDIYW